MPAFGQSSPPHPAALSRQPRLKIQVSVPVWLKLPHWVRPQTGRKSPPCASVLGRGGLRRPQSWFPLRGSVGLRHLLTLLPALGPPQTREPLTLEESRFSGMVVLDRGGGADFAPWGIGQCLGAFGAAPLAPRGERTEMLIEGVGQPPDPQQRMMWPQMSAVLSQGGWGSLTAVVSRQSPRTAMCSWLGVRQPQAAPSPEGRQSSAEPQPRP